jgi:hypothetical protein
VQPQIPFHGLYFWPIFVKHMTHFTEILFGKPWRISDFHQRLFNGLSLFTTIAPPFSPSTAFFHPHFYKHLVFDKVVH